jgi:hypothetical protein
VSIVNISSEDLEAGRSPHLVYGLLWNLLKASYSLRVMSLSRPLVYCSLSRLFIRTT